MSDAKGVNVPFAQHFKLSSEQSPTEKESIEEMKKTPYSHAVGNLLYSMVCTRPDLAHAMSVTSKFMENPKKSHWNAVKWIFRYLKGSINMVLAYGRAHTEEEASILGNSDANYAADLDKRRLTIGYVFKLWNSTVSWKAHLQSVVALSITEAEYIAVSEAINEALWLKGLTSELLGKSVKATLMCDSQKCCTLSQESSTP